MRDAVDHRWRSVAADAASVRDVDHIRDMLTEIEALEAEIAKYDPPSGNGSLVSWLTKNKGGERIEGPAFRELQRYMKNADEIPGSAYFNVLRSKINELDGGDDSYFMTFDDARAMRSVLPIDPSVDMAPLIKWLKLWPPRKLKTVSASEQVDISGAALVALRAYLKSKPSGSFPWEYERDRLIAANRHDADVRPWFVLDLRERLLP